jgi:hypothetical protein
MLKSWRGWMPLGQADQFGFRVRQQLDQKAAWSAEAATTPGELTLECYITVDAPPR